MYRFLGIIIFLVFCLSQATASPKANSSNLVTELKSEESYETSHFLFEKVDSTDEVSNQSNTAYPKPKKRKLKATLLSIFLGHFGVHRIYLGTSAEVPVAYSLTLGGGLGLLPLIDAIAIISAKDLEEFTNNDRVIMWSKPKGD